MKKLRNFLLFFGSASPIRAYLPLFSDCLPSLGSALSQMTSTPLLSMRNPNFSSWDRATPTSLTKYLHLPSGCSEVKQKEITPKEWKTIQFWAQPTWLPIYLLKENSPLILTIMYAQVLLIKKTDFIFSTSTFIWLFWVFHFIKVFYPLVSQ